MPQPSITEIIWKIKCLKFHSNFLEANELIDIAELKHNPAKFYYPKMEVYESGKWPHPKRFAHRVDYVDGQTLNYVIYCSFQSWSPNNNKPEFGSDNDLVPIRQKLIIWTNNGLGYWRMYGSLGFDELNNENPDLGIHFSYSDEKGIYTKATKAWH